MASFMKIVTASLAASLLVGVSGLSVRRDIDDLADNIMDVDNVLDDVDDIVVGSIALGVARDLSICWDDDYYNIGGSACTYQCTGNNTVHCVDNCCGTSLAMCTNDCTYTNLNGVKGSMPMCTNDCLGNAVMDACTSDCDTNGAAIDLPLCVEDCKTAGSAPLCKSDCVKYPAATATATTSATPTVGKPSTVASIANAMLRNDDIFDHADESDD